MVSWQALRLRTCLSHLISFQTPKSSRNGQNFKNRQIFPKFPKIHFKQNCKYLEQHLSGKWFHDKLCLWEPVFLAWFIFQYFLKSSQNSQKYQSLPKIAKKVKIVSKNGPKIVKQPGTGSLKEMVSRQNLPWRTCLSCLIYFSTSVRKLP